MNELQSRREDTEAGQMSFLEHLDELRKRIVRSVIFIVVAFIGCFFVSKYIYNFLEIPIKRALTEAAFRDMTAAGLDESSIGPLSGLKEGDRGKYVFGRPTSFGPIAVQAGASVEVTVAADGEGRLSLYTDEPLFTQGGIVAKGVRLPIDLAEKPSDVPDLGEKLVVQTAQEAFTLYVTVSLYAAIAVSIPFLLLQIWGFISPALYQHEKSYVTPFIALSSIAFVAGAAFAYYILFPPAVGYLLGVAEEFRPLLRATDYFDLITLIMLAMGVIFQMPAVTYVLARIGLVSPKFLIGNWKIALIIILIVAAFVSPTGDIPNMMLFAMPMIVLYVFSIFIAWFFGKKRQPEEAI
ncbi:MAG TPA: twin-arginine translocase subunit TatC [Pyrinomonadaceae bacterium]|nr:twin-arginine translocase subunit TatC [Pyrinomonadaceae bacterium]